MLSALKLRNQLPTIGIVVLMLAGSQPVLAEAPEGDEHRETRTAVRTEVEYRIPDVTVIREDGKTVSFPRELNDGRPVMVNFIFATCSAICPALSHVFSKVQSKLGEDAKHIHMVSISIDPEHDTPAKLRDYAAKFKAGPQWNHYTGTLEASVAIQKAFDAYRGDKMNHTPLTLIRGAPGKRWVRLEGFASPDALIQEISRLKEKRG